jgi:hypothetical protein
VTVVEVSDGSCGFRTRIAAHMEDAVWVGVEISSDCEAAAQWGRRIGRVEWRPCLGPHPLASDLWQSAVETLRHRSCPVLTGVLRAIEAEVGAARPAEILIRFLAGDASERIPESRHGDKAPSADG